MNTKPNAQHAYMAAAADISGMVSELQAYADNLHDVNPDVINWGNVGDLERIKQMLADVLAAAKQTSSLEMFFIEKLKPHFEEEIFKKGNMLTGEGVSK